MRIGHDLRRRILLYEYTSSGGLLGDIQTEWSASLAAEGWAMLAGLACDLAEIRVMRVQVLIDHRRLPAEIPGCDLQPVCSQQEELELLCESSAAADWTIVIAPEFDGILANRCRAVEQSGGRLLGPSSTLVELLSDKQRTADYLTTHGVRTASGILWRPGDPPSAPLPCPVVIKPNDGAGSHDTYLCRDPRTVERILSGYRRPARIETWVTGSPASVSFLCGPSGYFALVPCAQLLQMDDRIAYVGGSLPLPSRLETRASDLARRAVECLPGPFGYLGVDVILGDEPSGAADCVVEINPRSTTSYVGLRALARENLALAMLDVAEGREPTLSFGSHSLEFDPTGTVRHCPQFA
jgi:predicted ATP-grasp superfamily ATP-dependent carboligase